MKELKEFFGIDFLDGSILKGRFTGDFDIELQLVGNESVRFFVYPETKNFRLVWYGSSLELNDSGKVLYLQAVAKIATVLNSEESLENLIKILIGTK